MDIKTKIEELVNKIKSDKNLLTKFKENPTTAIEGIIGIDLPDDQIEKIVEGVKAKLSIDDIGDKLGGLGDAIGGLFGKK